MNSAFRLLAFGFIPLGTALSGILLQSVGTTSTILIFSIVTLALALATTINRNIKERAPDHAAPGRIARLNRPADLYYYVFQVQRLAQGVWQRIVDQFPVVVNADS